MAVSPFKTGHGMALQTYYGCKKYLDSNAESLQKSQSVYLSDVIGPGSYWNIVVLPENKIRLNRAASRVKKVFLDSSAGAPTSTSVYLADYRAGDGSHWLPKRFPGGEYSFKCDSTSGDRRYLCGNTNHRKDNSVYLEKTDEPSNTQWNILLTHYTGKSVQCIICAVYPSVPISSCEPNATYRSIEYDHLDSTWKGLQLGDNQKTPIASDFAVHLKAEVYKHSYDSDSTWPDDKGSLCGIMWGSIGGKMCALNFTIDPFQNLILFDPQNGQKVATDKFTPTFCMV